MNSRNVKINFHPGFWGLKPSFGLTVVMSTSADFVGKFFACYGGRQCRRFSNSRFGATLIFYSIAGF